MRIDERDTMSSRMNYRKGTFPYDYKRNSAKQAVDDELRVMPDICAEGAKTFNPV